MDQEENVQVGQPQPLPPQPAAAGRWPWVSRRSVLKYGAAGLACISCGGAAAYYFNQRVRPAAAANVFKHDAPMGGLWQRWQKRGWVKEARHYTKLGENIQCQLCPNECILEPEDRGRCRNRVHKDGKLYTLAYGNPCAVHEDPIEKKPLYHFLPKAYAFSIATSGCGFRCLNCQNWDISQRKPEETKDPRGASPRLTPKRWLSSARSVTERTSAFPEDIVAVAEVAGYESIAYTYSEPSVWYEYMFDTAAAARKKHIKNVWVTCGYIQQKPLMELCQVMDAANVDLKSFDEEIYKKLNSGKLEPILATLKTLKREGVWFEVTNLIVPTYTDKPEMIRRMCQWLLENVGPDYPLHFSRFHPQHKLTHLEPTPVEKLVEARSIAREVGLHYVYIGNCGDVEDAGTTFCPGCGEPIIRRHIYSVPQLELDDGKCRHCGTPIAGVWTA